MNIKVGDKVKQVKPMGVLGFNYVGSEFNVINIENDIITAKNGRLQFSSDIETLDNYFEIISELKTEKTRSYKRDCNKVIVNGRATIVILKDGSKGVSKCLPTDKFNEDLGYKIALNRALIKSLQKELKLLCR